MGWLRSLCVGSVAQPMCWVVIRSKIMPLCGPTCKFARFQAGLKFPSWTRVWQKFVCGTLETMSYIHSCESLNQTKIRIHYDQIYNGNIRNMLEIFRRMKTNLKLRTEIKSRNQIPCDPSDPLYCISMDLDNK